MYSVCQKKIAHPSFGLLEKTKSSNETIKKVLKYGPMLDYNPTANF